MNFEIAENRQNPTLHFEDGVAIMSVDMQARFNEAINPHDSGSKFLVVNYIPHSG